jgi:hypothetical protein
MDQPSDIDPVAFYRTELAFVDEQLARLRTALETEHAYPVAEALTDAYVAFAAVRARLEIGILGAQRVMADAARYRAMRVPPHKGEG